MADFPGGLSGVDEYLNRTVSIPTSTTVDPTTGVVTTTESSFTMRELICSLLAGNGLKLPNLQICLKANLGRLLNNAGVNWQGALADLYTALNEAEQALEDFTAHTDIENVLGRLNGAIAEFAAVANMINFCGTPIVPRAIPNVLSDMFGSFTGQGKQLLDNLGTMADSDIGGCINSDGTFNPIFSGGVLKDIQDNLSNLANLPQSTLDGFTNTLKAFKNDIDNLITFENNFGTGSTDTGGKGGSNFAPTTRVHTGVGVGIDPNNITLQQAQGIANNLKSNYDALKNYEVDGAGNNIFHYLLEPELIAKLDEQNNPIATVGEQTPVYDYCGKVIGYTNNVTQGNTQTSAGTSASIPVQPGIQGLSQSGQKIHNEPVATTNLANTAAGSTGSSGGGGGSSASVSGVNTANPSLNPSLTFNSTSGTLTYTPPDLSQYTTTANLAPVALSGDYYALSNRPSVTVPTVVSAFTNDAGYITNTPVNAVQTNLNSTNSKLNTIVAQVNTYHNSAIARLNTTKASFQALLPTGDANLDSAINDLITDINGMISEAQAAIITQTF